MGVERTRVSPGGRLKDDFKKESEAKQRGSKCLSKKKEAKKDRNVPDGRENQF